MQEAGDTRSFGTGPRLARSGFGLGSPSSVATGASLLPFLALFWALVAIATGGSPLLGWGAAAGWGPWFGLLALLAPAAALPLVLLPAWLGDPQERSVGAWFSVSLLLVYGASLRVASYVGWIGAEGFWVYFVGVAAVLASVTGARRWAASRRPTRPAGGPRFRDVGSVILVGSALALGLPTAGILSTPALILGLAGLYVGSIVAGSSRLLHPLAPCRRTLIASVATGSGVALALAAALQWCFANPLVLAVVPAALLGLVAALAPPHATERGTLAVPPGAYDPRVGSAWAWWRAAVGGLAALLLVLGSAWAGGWLPTSLCL